MAYKADKMHEKLFVTSLLVLGRHVKLVLGSRLRFQDLLRHHSFTAFLVDSLFNNTIKLGHIPSRSARIYGLPGATGQRREGENIDASEREPVALVARNYRGHLRALVSPCAQSLLATARTGCCQSHGTFAQRANVGIPSFRQPAQANLRACGTGCNLGNSPGTRNAPRMRDERKSHHT